MRSITRDAGYTLIEMMVAVMLVGILAAMAVFEIGNARLGMRGDGAMRAVMAELNAAREIAIAQRKYVEVTFLGSDQLRVTRHEDPAGTVTTVLREITFESGVEYGLIEGIADTPDAFGNAAAIDFGLAATLRFSTDGSLIDPAGAPVNGSIFLAVPGVSQSLRAVTVLGSTGRVRGYRWLGTQWDQV